MQNDFLKSLQSRKTLLLVVVAFLLLVWSGFLSINFPWQKSRDLDLDGYISIEFKGDDCDDTDARIHPGAEDIPDDGVDQDCDDNDSVLSISNKDDKDGDGFSAEEDCDDTDKNINPDTHEIYNLIDDNCRNGIDEGFSSIKILENFVIPNYSSETIIRTSKRIFASGNIEEAYIYVKAGVDTPLRPLTKFDSIYLYFDLPETSGHFINSESLNTDVLGGNLTTLVYNLENFDLAVSEKNDKNEILKAPESRNLLSLLREGGEYNVGAFVATERYGQIIELTIGYKGGHIAPR